MGRAGKVGVATTHTAEEPPLSFFYIRRCCFQPDKFQELSTIQGLICIVSDVGVPKVVSAIRIIKGSHLRGESLCFSN